MPGTRRGLRYRGLVTADAGLDFEVPIVLRDEEPIAYAEGIRIARRLRAPGYAPVGLLPADDATVAAPVCVQLAAALVDVTAHSSAFVHAMARPPAPSSGVSPPRGATRWLQPSLALVTPSREEAPCAQAAAAREAIEYAAARFRHVVVDLSGFARIGELATVLASVRRVVVVASALVTTERAVLEAVALVPRPKRMGVMLVG
jgi:hypothetical protein